MQLTVADRECLNKEVRHILFCNKNLRLPALAVEFYHSGFKVKPIRGTDKTYHRTVGPLRIDHQVHFLARCVFLLVGNDLYVIEAESAVTETGSGNRKYIRAFFFMIFAVGNGT